MLLLLLHLPGPQSCGRKKQGHSPTTTLFRLNTKAKKWRRRREKKQSREILPEFFLPLTFAQKNLTTEKNHCQSGGTGTDGGWVGIEQPFVIPPPTSMKLSLLSKPEVECISFQGERERERKVQFCPFSMSRNV